jgi:imidazolonepropionase-like amidohydrolase
LHWLRPHPCRIIYGMFSRALAAFVVVVSPSTGASYRFGQVWDGDNVQKNVCVNIRGNKIQSVGACPAGAIDMLRYTAIPGMIDVHTHMTYVQENPVSQAGRGDIAGDSSMPTMSVMRWNWMLLAGI